MKISKFWKRLGIALGVFLSVSVVTLVACAYWLLGWSRLSRPEFHCSWNEQQKADLMEMDQFFCRNDSARRLLFYHALEKGTLKKEGWRSGLDALLYYRKVFKPMREAFFETISTGRGDVRTPDGMPVAAYAMRLQKRALVKELVQRGCNPATPYDAWDAPTWMLPQPSDKSNLLTDALAVNSVYFDTEQNPADVEQMLDFLAQHGAGVLQLPSVPLACLNACVWAEEDGGAALAWLIRHGVHVDDKMQAILKQEYCRTTREALLREGLLPENTAE